FVGFPNVICATPLIGVVNHSASSVATTTNFGHEWARRLVTFEHFALKAMFRFITILLCARLASEFVVLEASSSNASAAFPAVFFRAGGSRFCHHQPSDRRSCTPLDLSCHRR